MILGLAFQWIPWLYNKCRDAIEFSSSISRMIYKDIFVKSELLYVKNCHLPVSSKLFNLNKVNPGFIIWKATLDPPLFIDPKAQDSQKKHISFLGFVVNIPGMDPIDMTDWINELRWIGVKQPLPSEIFILWCYTNGVPYCHTMNGATVEIITDDGTTIKKGLNDFLHTSMYDGI